MILTLFFFFFITKSKNYYEPGVLLEATPLFLRGRGKAVYILSSSDPTLALLLMGFTEYDDYFFIIFIFGNKIFVYSLSMVFPLFSISIFVCIGYLVFCARIPYLL
ncbi:hypothetical protein HanIR_Chr15g0754711 [Helianthus annuus]|nr:hypothetical protein HanIR_Chr15g0754711 [Helianthus annuus]